MNSADDREPLEVLASEFMERLRRGDDVTVESYAAAHPELAADIRDLFPTVVAAEKLKTRELAAPVILPHPGMTVGKYVLGDCLGQGSLGTVWRSEHPVLGLPVAIKILRPDTPGNDEERARRFVTEARAAARIDHPHVVRVYDAGVDNGLRYLVMEYVPGGNVAELLARSPGPLPTARAVAIAQAVANALGAVAAAGIVHRDIKPDNILLTLDGTPKLADLGLAKTIAARAEECLTATGVSLGTPLYMAPEQALGDRRVDVRADIYSLGCTLYQMLTGTPPYTGSTPYRIVQQHLRGPIPNPTAVNRSVSPGLAWIVARCLAKDPAERYQTPAELAADLARGGAPPMATAPSRWAWGAAAALVVLTLAMAVALVVNLRPPPSRAAEPAAPAARLPATGWGTVDGDPKGALPRDVVRRNIALQGDDTILLPGAADEFRRFLYEERPVPPRFTMKLEARGVIECGIIDPREDFRAWTQPLRPAANGRDAWRSVRIRRTAAGIRVSVDGEQYLADEQNSAIPGVFFVTVPPGGTGEIRKFELIADQ